MNNEQQQIIEEAYNKWIKYSWNSRIYPNQNDKDIFIDRIKTEPNFSIHCGLKIEERELNLEERTQYKKKRDGIARTFAPYTHQMLDGSNIPTKLITITYKEQTIESYE